MIKIDEEKKVDDIEEDTNKLTEKVTSRIKEIGNSPIDVNLWLKVFAMLCIGFFFAGVFISGIYYNNKVVGKVNVVLDQVFDDKHRCIDWDKITPELNETLKNYSIELNMSKNAS